MLRLALIACALACAPILLAWEDLAGKDAPVFDATVCVNPPADGCLNLEACQGSVVLIKFWGPN
jgi:hypothetical protein